MKKMTTWTLGILVLGNMAWAGNTTAKRQTAADPDGMPVAADASCRRAAITVATTAAQDQLANITDCTSETPQLDVISVNKEYHVVVTCKNGEGAYYDIVTHVSAHGGCHASIKSNPPQGMPAH